MANIKAVLRQHKKTMSSKEYKAWLEKKLDQHQIDKYRLMAVVIVIERSLGDLLSRRGSNRKYARPYYRLWDEDNKPTRAWVHAAELALWLKYNGFKADPYVHAIADHPFVQKFVTNKKKRAQIPLSVLFPSARKNNFRLRSYTDHFKSWQFKH